MELRALRVLRGEPELLERHRLSRYTTVMPIDQWPVVRLPAAELRVEREHSNSRYCKYDHFPRAALTPPLSELINPTYELLQP